VYKAMQKFSNQSESWFNALRVFFINDLYASTWKVKIL